MGHRDSLYRLSEWWEFDDALVGGQRAGKRGRGAEGKTPIWVACEDRGERAGFLAMEAVSQVTHPHVADFVQRRLVPQHTVLPMPCWPSLACRAAKFIAHEHPARAGQSMVWNLAQGKMLKRRSVVEASSE
ncbi:hypothetical protein E3U44_16400 [Nitrosococcus wardiae]|uniref:ISXO2-like transposase domain-containing protein n=1 Tax=Nitrosococcus wardiae TaxID=1814290 RepID=A0A4P7C060_9GAMM|nr:hypothetical protein E3U44_16400 [Nitrosococcus wardiae]